MAQGAGAQLPRTSAIRSASPGPPPADFVQIAPTPSIVRGILVYTPVTGRAYQYWNQYVVFRAVGFSGTWHGQVTDTMSYYLRATDDNREPVLSTAGLSYRYGYTERNDVYAHFFWSFVSNSLMYTASLPNVSVDALSPGGRFLAAAVVLDTEHENLQQRWLPWHDNGPARLWTFDNDKFLIDPARDATSGTDSKHHISESAARRPLAWTSDNQRLYTHEPPISRFVFLSSGIPNSPMFYDHSSSAPVIDAPFKFPSVWIADPVTKATHQVVDRAYDPSPSPDGKWIAYFGWSPAEAPTADKPAAAPQIWLFNIAQRKSYPALDRDRGMLLWTPDSRSLVLVRVDEPENRHVVTVSVLPLAEAATGAPPSLQPVRDVATVTATDFEPNRGIWPDSILVQGVSRNGKYLVLDITEYTGLNDKKDRYMSEKTMRAIDLSTGKVTLIATARPPDPYQFFTWSWFDESDAPVSAALPAK